MPDDNYEIISINSKCGNCNDDMTDLFVYTEEVFCYTCLGDMLVNEALFFDWAVNLEDYLDEDNNNNDEEEGLEDDAT